MITYKNIKDGPTFVYMKDLKAYLYWKDSRNVIF